MTASHADPNASPADDVPGVRSAEPTSVNVRRTARLAGLRGFETPTLEQVERRRWELFGTTFFVLVAFAIGMVILSFLDERPSWLPESMNASLNVVRVALVLLSVAFAVYVMDKERHLRRLTKVLVNERVLTAALSNRLKEISLLTEAGKAVSSTLEMEDVLGIILRAAFELLEADEGSVMLAEGEDLVVAAAVGHPKRFIGDRHPMTEGLSGYVARTSEPLLIEGRADTAQSGPAAPDKPAIRSAMSVPLKIQGKLLGVLNLNVISGERRYDEYDLRALGLFAEHAAMAIRHARVLRSERDLRLQLAELDRIRAELVGSMAHDLKTPLTMILGSAKVLLRRDDLDRQNARHFTERIVNQSERLLALIERLLEAARSHTGTLPLAPATHDLVPLVENMAVSYATAHDRPIEISAEAEHIQAFVDCHALEQALANLLENAIKHTPAGTPIQIEIRSGEDEVQLVVRDRGPGIPEEDLPTLFLPFRRGTTLGSGVGLGLFIVSNLVTNMGGRIDVHNAGGAVFTMTLPAHPAAQREQPEPARERSG